MPSLGPYMSLEHFECQGELFFQFTSQPLAEAQASPGALASGPFQQPQLQRPTWLPLSDQVNITRGCFLKPTQTQHFGYTFSEDYGPHQPFTS